VWIRESFLPKRIRTVSLPSKYPFSFAHKRIGVDPSGHCARSAHVEDSGYESGLSIRNLNYIAVLILERSRRSLLLGFILFFLLRVRLSLFLLILKTRSIGTVANRGVSICVDRRQRIIPHIRI